MRLLDWHIIDHAAAVCPLCLAAPVALQPTHAAVDKKESTGSSRLGLLGQPTEHVWFPGVSWDLTPVFPTTLCIVVGYE